MSMATRPTAKLTLNTRPQARAVSRLARKIGIRVCTFAHGECDCRRRDSLCPQVEKEAYAIIDALRTVDGGDV